MLELELVYCLNVNKSKMQGVLSCSTNSSNRKQNKSKANISSLSSSEYDEVEKTFLEKYVRSKEKRRLFWKIKRHFWKTKGQF